MDTAPCTESSSEGLQRYSNAVLRAVHPAAPTSSSDAAQRVGSNRVTLRRNEASRYSRLMTSAISSAVAKRS